MTALVGDVQEYCSIQTTQAQTEVRVVGDNKNQHLFNTSTAIELCQKSTCIVGESTSPYRLVMEEAMTTKISDILAAECVTSGQAFRRALRATYIGIDFVLTLFGNVLTIVVTRKVDDFSDSAKVLITSLALADLGVALIAATSLPVEILGHWIFPGWVCVASFVCFYSFTAVSVVMVTLMTFDRLVAVVRPLRYALIWPKKRSIIAVVIVWSGCVTSAVSTTMNNEIIYNECSAVCTTAGRNIPPSIASVLIFYIIPLALIMVMNIKLLLVALGHANHSKRRRVAVSRPDVPGQPAPRSVRGKAVGVISSVTFAFAVSWSVYQAKLVHGALSDGSALPEWIEFTAIWLAMTNSWWNVVIYSIMNRSFRKHTRSVLRRLCPWCPRPTEIVPYEIALVNFRSQPPV